MNSEGIPVLLRTQDLNAVAPIPLVTKTSGATIVLFGAALFCLTWLTSFVHGRRLAYSYLTGNTALMCPDVVLIP